ncbi:MAG: beta-ketoacyl-[acyl-carrier-protein] synthase family protein [Phycisphaerales bacterium JB037]
MSQRRVVITGMGWETPLGFDIAGVWDKLLSGTSAIGPCERFDARTFPTNFVAEIKDFDLAARIGAARVAYHEGAGTHTRYALSAATRAWAMSGLAEYTGLDRGRVGVYLGAGEGPPDSLAFMRTHVEGWDAEKRDLDYARWVEAARHHLSLAGELEQEPDSVIPHIAEEFGLEGPSFNCMTACAASTQSVGEAFEMIRRGDVDAMMAGGTHSMIHPLGMSGFIRLTAMSTRRDDPATASRPFDVTRDGFVMGEGAGIVILEELEHAKARGAEILAELGGFGSTCDAYRITDIKPDGGGAQEAMRRACAQAGIDPTKPGDDGRPPIHYISAHGTGTPENDGIETRAVKGVFGELAGKVPFSSVKSMLGHLIQAAGTVEMMTCVQAIRTGWLPPTINLHNPDPRCDLDYIPNEPRDLREQGVEVCLSNGFGFGGQNDCVCVKKFAG